MNQTEFTFNDCSFIDLTSEIGQEEVENKLDNDEIYLDDSLSYTPLAQFIFEKKYDETFELVENHIKKSTVYVYITKDLSNESEEHIVSTGTKLTLEEFQYKVNTGELDLSEYLIQFKTEIDKI